MSAQELMVDFPTPRENHSNQTVLKPTFKSILNLRFVS